MLCSFVLFVSSFGFISPEKPFCGSGQLRYLFIYLVFEVFRKFESHSQCHLSRSVTFGEPNISLLSGGWLLVSNIVKTSLSLQLSVETSYRGISSYHNNKTVLTKSAMKELWTHLSFTQMRFHCSKQQGRIFHVTTVTNSTGEAVVQYFSGQTDVMPHSCNSFVVMDDDTSKAVKVRKKWGVENGVKNVGKWSGSGSNESRLYRYVVFVWYAYH